MWLDDDGDDDPILGPVPDPSSRQWRHPSEVAAENARNAELARAGELVRPGATSGGGSILWPIAVVGGSIAVAAFGVLGLYFLGASTAPEVVTVGAQGTGVLAFDPHLQARSIGDGPLDPESHLLRSDDQLTDDSDDGRAADDDDAERKSQRAGGVDPEDGTPTDGPYANGRSGTPGEVLPETSTPGTVSPLKPAAGPETPPGPAIYVDDDLNSKRLASLVATGEYLLSSASALVGHNQVFVWLNSRWVEATVGGTDMPSDVALILPEDRSAWPDLPKAHVELEPVGNGAQVFVGYCRSDTEPDAGATEPGCGNGKADGEVLPERSGDDPIPGDPTPIPEPSNGRAGGKSEPERAGVVISTVDPSRTMANHTVYEPIQTGIHRVEGLAGAPLRDRLGRITGLVLGSRDYLVSALPIERAVAIADSLMRWGVGSPAWLGIDSHPTPLGLEVDTVDENSPAAGEIAPGDILMSVNGKRIQGRDHLTHVMRQAGVGATLTLSYWSDDGGRLTTTVPIVNRPG